MKMEMRATDDIDIGTDITPTLFPLSFSLHNSYLHTHCSACFSPLPSESIPYSPLYCSPPCSVAHSSLHISSAERHLPPSADSSDLRTALRLLLSHRPSSSDRVAGLLSNHHILTCQDPSHPDDDVSERLKIGAKAMAAAIAKQRGTPNDDAVLEEATVALCAVLTNAVEVQDKEGRILGIAVFDPTFSWINHSCSPNTCYRFILSSSPFEEAKLLIAPFTRHSQGPQINTGVCSNSNEFGKGVLGYGPRLTLRSIKRIKKGEEVTVAYTDLLQPKATRQLELWSKYRFICYCKRCSALPFTYVDHALQELSAFNQGSSGSCSNYKFFKGMADRILTECVDDVISEYLSVGDPESCCEKLENILMHGLSDQLEGIEGKSHFRFTLHPVHHLSLNAYTTLTSAYKVRASDLLCTDSEININHLEAFDMSRTSAAYSLLLAGTTHHLFNSESSLIAFVANFWTGAGDSLLSLSRSSGWGKFDKLDQVVSNLASFTDFKCSRCLLVDKFRACVSGVQIKSADFDNLSNEFLRCVSDMTPKVWSFLVSDSQFLRSFKDPIDFSWLMSAKYSSSEDAVAHLNKTDIYDTRESENSTCICEEYTCTDNTVAHIFQLGVHCLAYGALLAFICYGPHSHLVCHVQNIRDCENISV